jgi:hypothetical protein
MTAHGRTGKPAKEDDEKMALRNGEKIRYAASTLL